MKGNFHARFLGGLGRVNRLRLPGAMRSLCNCLLLACLLTGSGCLTSKVVEKAKDQQQWDSETKEQETVPGHPTYYALVPLTVLVDIPTLPFIFLYSVIFPGH